MKKLLSTLVMFFMFTGYALSVEDDGLVSRGTDKKVKVQDSNKELNLVKQSKGVLIRVPVKNGKELSNFAQMRFVNSVVNSNTDIDKVWQTSKATSYNPILSEEEIESIKTDDGKIDQTCLGCLFRVRPWGGVYYRGYVTGWAPRYFAPSYNYWSSVNYGWYSYDYSYRYSWSSYRYNTYYYRGLWW